MWSMLPTPVWMMGECGANSAHEDPLVVSSSSLSAKGGVQQRSYNLLREVASQHEVWLLAFNQLSLLPKAGADRGSSL